MVIREMAMRKGDVQNAARIDLDRGVREFLQELKKIERRCVGADKSDDLEKETVDAIEHVSRYCSAYEEAVSFDPEAVKVAQADFRIKTDPYFLKSYFMNRARTWPMGYPGDYVTLEGVYRNTPMSTGIGALLDRYFHRTALAVAVRQRRDMMREILKAEMQKRRSPAILNVACGSCREIVEIAKEIERANATLICIDMDPGALEFSASRFAHANLPSSQVQFRKYNAMRMINAERNLREFGQQDIIYSIGLFDYLDDHVLPRLLEALYTMLRPGGVLITSFKDKDRYSLFDYHWLVDWSSFLQRSKADVNRVFEAAHIAPVNAPEMRVENGAIYFLSSIK